MIELSNGDLFEADVEALVNPVNCVGVMGAGLAARFKERYPENFRVYATACKIGLAPGEIVIYPVGNLRWILNVPTKRHWRDPSQFDDVAVGVEELSNVVRCLQITSIVIPALGCGLGLLKWSAVRAVIEKHFGPLNVRTLLFPPQK